jgi:hypothetical protein
VSIRLIVATLSASLVATPVAAQMCAGTASFAGRPVRAGASAEFVNSVSTLGVNAALGRPNAFFGELGVARTSDGGESSFDARLMGGYQMPLGTQNKLQFCPRIGVGHISGPNNVGGSNVDISGNEFLFGATIGLLASESPGFEFVPSMGIGYTTQYITLSGTAGGTTVDTHVKGTFGTIMFTPGLVFNRMITVQPNVIFPFGVDGRDVTYGFMVSFNFSS